MTIFRAEQTLVPPGLSSARHSTFPTVRLAAVLVRSKLTQRIGSARRAGAIVGDFLSFLHDAGHVLEPYIQHYGLPALLVIVYLEALGAPVPGESALVASSLLAANGEFSVWALVAVVWAAAVLGDSTGYAIGRFGGRPLLLKYGWLAKLTPERPGSFRRAFQAARPADRGRCPLRGRAQATQRHCRGFDGHGLAALPCSQCAGRCAVGANLGPWTLSRRRLVRG